MPVMSELTVLPFGAAVPPPPRLGGCDRGGNR
jgi:hypothetical protein